MVLEVLIEACVDEEERGQQPEAVGAALGGGRTELPETRCDQPSHEQLAGVQPGDQRPFVKEPVGSVWRQKDEPPCDDQIDARNQAKDDL